jgi:uncharacterized protein YbjT (DUF2867 family)
MTPAIRSVTLFGASGLVGSRCLRRLVETPSLERIVVAGRRPLETDQRPGDGRLVERVIDFDRLAAFADSVRSDAVICALGTTIKKAGSKERFRRIDLEYPFAIARLALQEGARHFLLVSSLGADASSRIFYNRVKGELEEAILALPYDAVTIVRPSLLMGDRDEFRPGEEVAKRLKFLFPARYRPVDADAVAATLVDEMTRTHDSRIIESQEIRERFDG